MQGHLPYSLDLAHSNFHPFPNMKRWLASQRFTNDEDVTVELLSQFTQGGVIYPSATLHQYPHHCSALALSPDLTTAI
ncbi:hypothetical protein J6590_051084 [Homalodisca vitripennis]|nr:hypothetical protein J6590_051084 [Homalodisca vitripennis]